MHIHNVYFWLNDGLDTSDVTAFEKGLASLCGDVAALSGWYGKPAQTDRDVVENSYSYGLVLVFENLQAHDQYQGGAVHLQFVDDHLLKWGRVVVHDVETA
ncbi:MAG: Dabb family protein [Candidatus Latescibacteria bacterium]|jgi:hypothetical protein|nr:Dabb family protein [Candidatus Latescibacterota bacterium]MBT5829847.1 Dabb family protein [Candidatus Latescibacterota bacterium]